MKDPKVGDGSEGTSKVNKNPTRHSPRILGTYIVHEMRFPIDPIDRRTYRHRTDRPTTPTAQLELTIPNPSEFQVQSSSSVAMPSNHMIVDELAHNSKRKGAYKIGGAYSRQVKKYHKYAALRKLHLQKNIGLSSSKGGDCEEDLAPHLGTILMKTPVSPKRRKEEYLSRLKNIKLQEK
ncbi:hypothetical protein Lal_00039746 [Lupinus albus]|nr:hypothetical protein Lal_00039746 [Lupinus albus]